MTIDVDGIKATTDIVSVVGAYVSLKKRGTEFVGLCPFHGEKTPSFTVIPAKGFVHCFGCGFSEDVIGFLQEIESLDFKEAAERLNGGRKWTPKTPIVHEPAKPLPQRITSKPPPEALEPSFEIRGLGKPGIVFAIKDLDGDLLGYECRYECDGKKEVRIWTWGARDGQEPCWACGHFTAPRPLFGLPRLRERPERPDAQVQVFEGPKKADAGRRLLTGLPCISWTGGANAWHKHDWNPLKGRKLVLWPDADRQTATDTQAKKLKIKEGDVLPYHEQPGQKAMIGLAALLADPNGLACSVKIIDVNGMPASWDIADAEADGWDTAKLIEWAKPRAKEYTPTGPPKSPEEEPQTEAGPAPRAAQAVDIEDDGEAGDPEGDDEAMPASMSEDMLAEAFAKKNAENWRYVKRWGQWFEWRGDGWYIDETAMVDRLAVELARQAIYWDEAKELSTSQKRAIGTRRTAGAVRDLAMSDRRIAATVAQWDKDPWLLGVPGGVVDLRTGGVIEAKRKQYITKRASVAPEKGDAPIWLKFLDTVTAGNQELIGFLQRWAGYSMTGDTREQCLAFLYGTGQNGKGVFITTLSRILGDYAVTADADVFMESQHNRHPTEMARLRGARLVYVDETDSSKRWNEKRIKRITGGGKIEAHFMRQDDFEFEPQFKLLIAGNHKPQLRGVGIAIERRLKLVPFTVTIPDRERDDELSEKLRAEYPKILQWMIEGCLAWLDGGLKAPPEVVEATKAYIESEDTIGEWIEERCEQKDRTARPIAYKNYKAWIEGRGENAWSQKAFSGALVDKSYAVQKSNGTYFIVGLSLKQFTQEEPVRGRYYEDR